MTDALPYLIGGAVVIVAEALLLTLIWWPADRCESGERHRWETFQRAGKWRCSSCGIIEDEHGRRFAGWDEYLADKEIKR